MKKRNWNFWSHRHIHCIWMWQVSTKGILCQFSRFLRTGKRVPTSIPHFELLYSLMHHYSLFPNQHFQFPSCTNCAKPESLFAGHASTEILMVFGGVLWKKRNDVGCQDSVLQGLSLCWWCVMVTGCGHGIDHGTVGPLSQCPRTVAFIPAHKHSIKKPLYVVDLSSSISWFEICLDFNLLEELFKIFC